jgi:2-polyprenyl-3-methyl-5-hydroxy-6-metoxy-1,4-benzoquinol methylase
MENQNNISGFWKKYELDYSGDTTSSELIRLSKKYIKGEVLDVGAGSGALIQKYQMQYGIDMAPKNSQHNRGSITNIAF